MLGASVLPTERITHVGAGELAALRDFNPAYVGSGSGPPDFCSCTLKVPRSAVGSGSGRPEPARPMSQHGQIRHIIKVTDCPKERREHAARSLRRKRCVEDVPRITPAQTLGQYPTEATRSVNEPVLGVAIAFSQARLET
jgi:hypothetical protein